MPLYSYVCTNCKKQTTAVLSINERREPCNIPCEDCGGVVDLMIGCTNFIYQRSGAVKTSDNFNDRMKVIRENTPYAFKSNLDKSIR